MTALGVLILVGTALVVLGIVSNPDPPATTCVKVCAPQQAIAYTQPSFSCLCGL